MPNVSVNRDELFKRLGENWGAQPNKPSPEADKAFDELCFEFGIELDDVTSEKDIQLKETGSASQNASEDIIYIIAVPANRYDLLCIEGLARALRIFMGKETPPTYKVVQPKDNNMIKMTALKEVGNIRPHVVCAVLRDVHFTPEFYKSFIDLQDKLHQNIGRRRTLVSIGTHDLDTIKGPFTYEALPPKDIKFAPLNSTTVMDGIELMEYLEKNAEHLKPYLPIIRNSPVYPVIYDSNRVVLSLPPIINGDHSKITLNTKNIFIEVTATDLTKASIVLNTMCAMFSEYCKQKFTIESVEVLNYTGKSVIYPEISPKFVEANVDYIKRSVGINLEYNSIVNLLSKMSLEVINHNKEKNEIKVSVPCTRSDVIHACDVMEDVAIAYGFNKLEKVSPSTVTQGKQQILNKVTDLLRRDIAMTGFSEILTLALCSREENYKNMCKEEDGLCITVGNPKAAEFQIARTSILVGLLKTVKHNKKTPLPLKLFEISDVVLKTEKKDVGSQNKRHLGAIYCAQSSEFGHIHGLLDRIMQLNNVVWKEASKPAPKQNYYYLRPSQDPTFFPSGRADIIFNEEKIGTIGIVHPEVLENFKIPFPCSALELSIEPFV